MNLRCPWRDGDCGLARERRKEDEWGKTNAWVTEVEKIFFDRNDIGAVYCELVKFFLTEAENFSTESKIYPDFEVGLSVERWVWREERRKIFSEVSSRAAFIDFFEVVCMGLKQVALFGVSVTEFV